MSRTTRLSIAALLAAILATALGLSSTVSAVPGEEGISATPGTVDAGDTVTLIVDVPDICAAFLPADVPVLVHPTDAAVDTGWSSTVTVDYDMDVHAYRGTTTVSVDTLLAQDSTRGSWTATALLDEIFCVEPLDPVSTTFTIQQLPTPSTTTTTTTVPPGPTPPDPSPEPGPVPGPPLGPGQNPGSGPSAPPAVGLPAEQPATHSG